MGALDLQNKFHTAMSQLPNVSFFVKPVHRHPANQYNRHIPNSQHHSQREVKCRNVTVQTLIYNAFVTLASYVSIVMPSDNP